MTIEVIEPVLHNRTARQVERDTRKHEAMARRRLTSKGATIAAVAIAFFWTIPTFGLFVTSFRPPAATQTTGWWTAFTPPDFTLGNYSAALTSGNTTLTLAASFLNSLAITIPVVLFALAIAALIAYAFAWIDFKGRNFFFIFIFALQIVPLQMALVPLLSLFSRGLTINGVGIFPGLELRGLEHSFATVWIAHTIFAMPLAIFLLHNFIAEIPNDVIEAARVDGATHGQVFFRIVLPLATPALASFAIFQFIWVWNDLLVALIFSGGTQDVAPLTQRLAELVGTRGQDWQLLTASAFISIVQEDGDAAARLRRLYPS